MDFLYFRKTTALIVLSAFLITDLGAQAPRFSYAETPSSPAPKSSIQPQIFYIEESHASQSLQNNVVAILNRVASSLPPAGKLHVLLEGTEKGSISHEIISQFPVPSLKKSLVEYFQKKLIKKTFVLK